MTGGAHAFRMTELRGRAAYLWRRALRRAQRVLDDGGLPGYLSTNAMSTSDARRARHKTKLPSIGLRWLGFRRCCGARDAIGIAILIPVFVVAMGVVASLFGLQTSPAERESLPATFLDLAQVVGAAAGVVFAVLIFAVEFQVSQAGPLAPLTKFLHRSSGMIPDAAVVIGATASAVASSFWVENELPGSGLLFQVAVFGLTLLALGLVLWHFCRILRDATGDVFTQLERALLPYLGDIQDERRAAEDLATRFERLCESNGLAVTTFGPTLRQGEPIRFALSSRGTVRDVRVHRFEALAAHLRTRCPSYTANIRPILSGWTGGTCLLLAKRDPGRVPGPAAEQIDTGREATAATPAEEIDRETIQRLLDRSIVVGPGLTPTAQDVGDALRVLVRACEREAEAGRAVELRQHLDVLESMIREWSGNYGAAADMFALVDTGPFLFPASVSRALHRLLRSGIKSGHRAVFDEIEMFLHNLIYISGQTKEDGLAREGVGLLGSMYTIALSELAADTEPTEITATFDRFAHQLASYLPTWDLSRASAARSSLYDSVITALLRMLREAIDQNRATDAWAFYTQLFEHERDSAPRFREREDRAGYGAVLDELVQIARIATAGWCVRRLQSGEPGEAAERVLQACTQVDYGIPALVRLWQTASRGSSEDTRGVGAPLDRLGVSRWEPEARDVDRPGFPQVYSVDERWQLDGVLAMLLAQAPPTYNWEEMPPLQDGVWEIGVLRSRLEELAQEDWLAIPAGERSERIAGILTPIDRSLLQAGKRRLQELLGAGLDEARWRQLQQELQAAYNIGECHSGRLRELGLAGVGEARWSPLRTRRRWNLHRVDLASGFEAAHGTASILARDIGRHQDVSLFGRIEDTLVAEGMLPMAAGALGGTIEGAIERLNEIGWSANLLIVPEGAEMNKHLRQTRLTETDGNEAYGRVRSLCGLTVMKWPYKNPRSIVVCDTRGLFAAVSHGGRIPSPRIDLVDWEPPSLAAVSACLEAAESVDGLPRLQDVHALAEVSLEPCLGLADVSAGMAIALPTDVETGIERPAGEFKPASWFDGNTTIKPGRLRKAASAQRKSKRVRSRTEGGVRLYSVEDARRWWPGDFRST